jgi:hypothetical protein
MIDTTMGMGTARKGQSSRKSKVTDETREESRRLKAIWDERKTLSQDLFGEQFEIGNQGAVWQFLNGVTALSLKAARGFARGLRCQIADFSPRLAAEAAKNAAFAPGVEVASILVPIGWHRAPLINYAQAGVWAEIADGYAPSDATAWLLTDLELSAAAFALKIEDESMLPLFRPGDRVVIDPAVAPRPGDFVVAKSSNGEVMFKKYRPRGVNAQGQKVIELTPLNSDFPPVRSDTSPFVIIGTMVEHRRYRTAAAQAGGLRNV